ncbi:type I methionyl aminopeptidase [Paenibacillus rigui]|uniref:Methionine aminopeptidase n=1 Tax=Paenibacillus rigui TaxID=554312 RepID=A0A229UIP8_9BACL|nr:type I methionyl aminopeptidase [Paenibacillus rigui]OXM83337.1 type I methionyl aminopeptidase [Paenibacillus rigui]
MVILKTPQEIAKIREAGRILAKCHQAIAAMVRPGVTTLEINDFVEAFLLRQGAKQVTKGYLGFPFATCASVNDVIAHGFPNKTPLQDGDIVKIDIVCSVDGWMADSARTYTVGQASKEAKRLIQITQECLELAIPKAVIGKHIGDVMHVIQRHAENAGFSVVRDLVGHGIGRALHEDPKFQHVGTPGKGFKLKEGMVITIEPMINEGSPDMYIESDGWTARTWDGGWSAQFEHTVAITKEGPQVLTKL